jgi:hypothetical protein
VLACAGILDAGALVHDKSGFEMPWIAIMRGRDVNENDISKAFIIRGLPPVQAHIAK